MQKLLEVGTRNLLLQNPRLQVHQVQWFTQIREPLRIQVVLQSEREDKLSASQD